MATRWFLGVSASNPVTEVVVKSDFTLKEGLFWLLAVHYLKEANWHDSWSASNIASAFSSFLSYGVFQITTAGLEAWRYLFIIKGSLTRVSSGKMSQSGSSTATYQFPASTFFT